MGAGTPGGPGIRPPEGGFEGPGIRPPKSKPSRDEIQFDLGFPSNDRPGTRPPKPPKGNKSPEIFDKLLEGIKKSGGLPGGPRGGKPFGGRGGKPIVSIPAPGSDIPLGPDDRPLDPGGDPFPPKPKIIMGPDDRPVEVWPWGREDDPDYDRKKKEYFEKKMGPMPKPEPFGTGPRPPRMREPDFMSGPKGGRPPRMREPDFMSGPKGGRPPRMREPDFMSGPKGGRPPRGTKKEAVFFGGRSPSTESRRPTKESPKRGMRKAGPVDTETRNKFEEMLAYMKSFQR
jgi:hypothetical protein